MEYTKREAVRARRDGVWAYRQGYTIDANPYANPNAWPDPELAKVWRQGYMKAWEADPLAKL